MDEKKGAGQGRGEIALYDAINLNIGANILYSSIYDQPLKQEIDKGPSMATTDSLTPWYFQNLQYNPWGKGNSWVAGYQPAGSKNFNNLGGDPGFVSGFAWAKDYTNMTDFAAGETNTTTDSVDLHLTSSSTAGIYNGWNYLMVDHDRDGVLRTATYQTYPVGAYFIH